MLHAPLSGCIPTDIDFALEANADYPILDGRGGGTGAAPDVFKHNISVPTMAALARARRHLDARGRSDMTLQVRTPGLDDVEAVGCGTHWRRVRRRRCRGQSLMLLAIVA